MALAALLAGCAWRLGDGGHAFPRFRALSGQLRARQAEGSILAIAPSLEIHVEAGYHHLVRHVAAGHVIAEDLGDRGWRAGGDVGALGCACEDLLRSVPSNGLRRHSAVLLACRRNIKSKRGPH